MNIGIIGCGFIGQKRSKNLAGHRLVAVCDVDFQKAHELREQYGKETCEAFKDWRELLDPRSDIDIVIVCTTHNLLAPIGLAALKAGKHVLLEKPGAMSSSEFEPLIKTAKEMKKTLHVGFNHRFHPAILMAQSILYQNNAEPVMFIRARYGHGGRLGYNKEWRADASISGGGELIDQGMHLIDLSRMFMGDFSEAFGHLPTYFWDMQVEDNAFLQLKNNEGGVAWLHASWTEWKNTFCFEIYTKKRKIQIDGLGGSYGVEKLSHYEMSPKLEPPKTTIYEYLEADKSWDLEFKNFISIIEYNQIPGAYNNGNGENCLEALKIVDKLYGRIK